MKEKLPPKTGLDFGAMMDEIDREEELKKESGNFDRQIEQMQKTTRDLEASCETLIIEALGMDETTAAIQETAVKIGWTLNLTTPNSRPLKMRRLHLNWTTSPSSR